MAVVQHAAVGRSQRPVVSVCIANYNGERMLEDCLESVLRQPGVDIEVIVHDDASTDGSLALLRGRYPQVEVLASSDNVGFCIANNRMVAHARGEYVLLLNNDAALFPDALATLLDEARGEPAPQLLTLPQFDWETGEPVDRGCLLDPFYNPVPNLDPSRREVAYAIGACLWIRRVLWDSLGGFPEWMESIGEDIYLCCLARLRGHAVRCAAGSGFRHRLGSSFGGARVTATGLRTTVRRRRLSERNKTAALLVCTPGPAMWPLLALHLALLLVEGMLISLANRAPRMFGEVYANVPRWLWRSRMLLLARRREVQSARSASLRGYLSAFRAWPAKLLLLWRFGVPRLR